MTLRRTVYFLGANRVEVREEALPAPAAGQMLVRTVVSAISPGTELLAYRGQFPPGMPVDSLLPGLSAEICYPLAYGYAAVGEVVELGPGLSPDWLGRAVFSFQPHTSHFLATPESILPVPAGLPVEAAAFLPNVETAISLVHDGAPILGERVLVLGQGVIGLLTAALLAEFPLQYLLTADCHPRRRAASLAVGASDCLDPQAPGFRRDACACLGPGADLSFELSGQPAVLDEAIALTRFSGRVVIGSWYGVKRAPLDLGGSFHRSRLRLIASQVSSLAPELSGRWDKARRFDVAWQALGRIHPETWITQRFPLDRADEAYRLLDQSPADTLQVIFDHR